MQINNAAPANALSLTAGQRIDVITDQGGAIRLADSAGAVGGILNLSAANIVSGQASLVAQLTQDPAFAGRATALDATSAVATPEGFFGAGQINVAVGNTFFVQNSGTALARGGFTAGTGGLKVTTANSVAGSLLADIIINGRVLPSGPLDNSVRSPFLINQNSLNNASFTPATGFTTGSTLNGCLISGALCSIGVSENGPLELIANDAAIEVQAVDEMLTEDERKKAAEDAQRLPNVRLNALMDIRPLSSAGAISEPVTAGGNASLWTNGGDAVSSATPSGDPK